jgi:hypothetical protein
MHSAFRSNELCIRTRCSPTLCAHEALTSSSIQFVLSRTLVPFLSLVGPLQYQTLYSRIWLSRLSHLPPLVSFPLLLSTAGLKFSGALLQIFQYHSSLLKRKRLLMKKREDLRICPTPCASESPAQARKRAESFK